MLIRRIARPMLAGVFVASGVNALRHPEQFAETVRPFVKKSQQTLPDEITDPLPSDVENLVRLNAAIQVGGGVLLAAGKFPRFAAITLAGSLVPTTVGGHDFWNETDPEVRAAQQIHFLKNVSLLGGLLIAAVDTEGKPSLAWRGRKAAGHATEAVSAALPFTGDSGGDTLDHLRSVTAERAGHVAEVAKDRAPVVLEAARERATPLAEAAAERTAKLAEIAKEKATPLAEAAADRGTELGGKAAKVARKRAEKAAKIARKEGDKAAQKARKRGSELADIAAQRGSDYAGQAQKRGADFAEQARERSLALAESARDRAPELADVARTRAADLASSAEAHGKKLSKRAQKRADKAAVKSAVASAVANLR